MREVQRAVRSFHKTLSGANPSLRRLSRKTYSWVAIYNQLVTFFGNIGSVLSVFVAGTGAITGGQFGGIRVSPAQMPFPIRFLIIVLAAAAVGWGLSTLVERLMRRRTDLRRMLRYLTPFALAAVLAWWVEWLSTDGYGDNIDFRIFALTGLGIALWVASQTFQANVQNMSSQAVERRNATLLIFSTVSIGLLLLSMFGVTL